MLLYTTTPPRFLRTRPYAAPVSTRSAPAATGTSVPSMDVAETESAYQVTFDVPGVTREQLKVTIEGKTVSIDTRRLVDDKPACVDASSEAATQAPALALIYSERTVRDPARPFARSFTVPVEVDQAGAQAKLAHGVLTLTLPKKQAARADVTIN